MTDQSLNTPVADSLVDFWKSRYDRQKLLIASITSLLQRYGESSDLDGLQSAFLLTLMGHYVASETCYTSVNDSGKLVLERTYGRRPDTFPELSLNSRFLSYVTDEGTPKSLTNIPLAARERLAAPYVEMYSIAAPLLHKDKLVGVVFLGPRVSKQKYTVSDLDVLFALCSVSATTFNNARLYLNAKLSASEVRKLYKVRSDIIGRITHEFRTPLTIAKASLALMPHTVHTTPWHGPIAESLDRLEVLIDSLLDLGEQGDHLTNPSDVSNPIVAVYSAVEQQLQEASKRSITFVMKQLPGVEHVDVKMSSENVHLALNALLDNAMKFSSEAAEVVIEIGISADPPTDADGILLRNWRDTTKDLLDTYTETPTEMGSTANTPAWSGTQHIVIRITDEGIGIPSDEIAAVADPFRQASNSPDVGVRGRGLGLSLVQKIVSQSGGQTYCRSVQGKGTTLTIFLPAVPRNQ